MTLGIFSARTGSLFATLLGLGVAGCVTTGVSTFPSATAQLDAAPEDAAPLHACALASELQPESALKFGEARNAALRARGEMSSGLQRIVHQIRDNPPKPADGENTPLSHYLPYAIFQTGYANYSADYRPLGLMLDQGYPFEAGHYMAFAAAEGLPENGDERSVAEAIGGLGMLERGTIHLAAGDVDCARSYFDHVVLDFRERAANETTFSRLTDTIFDSYAPQGYETVMAIDYKAMADILNRDERAANNIRLARDWQGRERARYQKKLSEARREQRQAIRDEEVARGEVSKLTGTLQHHLGETCRECAEIAERVSSPYVNPLPDFLSALWAEHEAERALQTGDRVGYTAERSRARAAYANAAELNPANPVVRNALRELEAWQQAQEDGTAEISPEGQLVHVAFDIGRAPEHKIAVLNIPLHPSIIIPFQIAFQEPVETPVAHVQVERGDGTPLAEVSPLADIEAMAMRHFRDELPVRLTKGALASLLQYAVQSQIAAQLEEDSGFAAMIANSLARNLLSNATQPGTEAWMSLPGRVAVARLRVDDAAERPVYLASYDASGRLLERQAVQLDPDGPTFVYGRAMGERLHAVTSARPVVEMADAGL